jgi:hypothetical protein
VIHVVEDDTAPPEDARIKEVWQNHPYYYSVVVKENNLTAKYEEVYQILQQFL